LTLGRCKVWACWNPQWPIFQCHFLCWREIPNPWIKLQKSNKLSRK